MNKTAIDFFSSIADEFATLYGRDPDFRDRFELWTTAIERYAKKTGTAYDIGCGSGIFSFYLAQLGMDVIGIDAAEGMIRVCQSYMQEHRIPNCQFIQASFPVAVQGLKPADLIICSSVLEYIDDLDAILRSFHGLLKEHGVMILSLPNRSSIYRHFERLRFRLTGRPEYYRFVRNVLSAKEGADRLREIGFACEQISYYSHPTRISRLTRLFLPAPYSENLFMGVFRKSVASG